MNKKHTTNLLLVEILIAVLFFMLSATVLVKVFATARGVTEKSAAETEALAQAQNVAEALYAAEDAGDYLAGAGYVLSHGAWSRSYGNYSLYVEAETEQTDAGTLWKGQVSAFYAVHDPDDPRPTDQLLFTLPVTRYKGAEQ